MGSWEGIFFSRSVCIERKTDEANKHNLTVYVPTDALNIEGLDFLQVSKC